MIEKRLLETHDIIKAERYKSLQTQPQLPDGIEPALDEADCAAAMSDKRYTAGEVFDRVRKSIA